MKNVVFAILIILCSCSQCFAVWMGYDYGRGNRVEIDTVRSQVREGAVIDVYDYDASRYILMGVVEIIRLQDGRIKIVLYDEECGEYRYVFME